MGALLKATRILLIGVGALTILLALIVLFRLWLADEAAEPTKERQRELMEARMIAMAVALFAEDNDGKRPLGFGVLVPDYLGEKIDTTRFNLYKPGTLIEMTEAIIGAEKSIGPDGKRIVLRADGVAYLLTPGD